MKILSAAQIREYDRYTMVHEPVSSLDLMERAAGACFEWIKNNVDPDHAFMIFCGTGNNGGDGIVIGRLLLERGYKVAVFILEGEKRTPDFEANYLRFSKLQEVSPLAHQDQFPLIEKNAIIIDAIFGTGLTRPLNDLAAQLVHHLNSSGNAVISIDIPTGMFADKSSVGNPVIAARQTLSFQVYKLALLMAENAPFLGNIHVLDIGLHPGYYEACVSQYATIDQGHVAAIYQPRGRSGHKYSFGHALLLAGSREMMGAAILSAKACLRAGAGLVTVRTEKETAGILQAAFPEAITSFDMDLEHLIKKKAAVGIGPGLATTSANADTLVDLLRSFDGPLVIDATALGLLKEHLPELKARTKQATILTPHTGEFERLFGKTSNDFERIKVCLHLAKEYNCYIILKGSHSFLACPGGKGYFNMTGNAGMAKAGSGDVLTGILTGLLAQGYQPEKACLLGVYLHGLAGDIAAANRSKESLIASDITEALGDGFTEISKGKQNA